MHNVAHKILISHTGQLQVYGDVCGDIGDGGHSLQGTGKEEKHPKPNIHDDRLGIWDHDDHLGIWDRMCHLATR